MLALTLKHPWPFAVCVLGKNIENRTWRPTQIGDWFAIHGGAEPTSRPRRMQVHSQACRLASSPEVGIRPLPFDPDSAVDVLGQVFRFSGIVAVCRYGGWVESSDSPWFEGPVGWVLAETVVLPEPVPCKGAQGLWALPEDVLARVREGFRAARAIGATP